MDFPESYSRATAVVVAAMGMSGGFVMKQITCCLTMRGFPYPCAEHPSPYFEKDEESLCRSLARKYGGELAVLNYWQWTATHEIPRADARNDETIEVNHETV